MPHAELVAHGQHVMTVCNACRYCEQLCPVFPAMEQRRVFAPTDLAYLANLCHNCGECLYACQYAPPHQFGIDVPRTLAQLRVASYEDFCWPHPLAVAFKRQGAAASVVLIALLSSVMLVLTWTINPDGLWRERPAGDFYGVMPHGVMVGLFGGIALLSGTALLVGLGRFWRDLQVDAPVQPSLGSMGRALADGLTLRHLHSGGVECTSREDTRNAWRRWWHHATFYGFLLCLASTSVAAFYHLAMGWHAPYALTSVPVTLGTLGGVALLVGIIGLVSHRRSRDGALLSADHKSIDAAFLTTLGTVSATGLALLALRDTQIMGPLLVVHLAAVLAWFVTLPYGKFVHGFYRVAALAKYHAEQPDAQVSD